MASRRNRGWFRTGYDPRRSKGFRRGYDPRRHILSNEDRRRGGIRSATRQMRQWAREQLGHEQGFTSDEDCPF